MSAPTFPAAASLVSSPRGNLTTPWSGETGGYLGSVAVADGCCIEAGEFLLSSGAGGLYRYRLAGNRLETLITDGSENVLWDNHTAAVVS